MPTLEQTFQTDLTFLHDAWDTLTLIADRHATTSHDTGRRQNTTAPLPINLGAFQLRDQLTQLARKLIHAGGLHPTRHMTVPDLLKGVLHNLDRFAALPSLPALADDTHRLADRVRSLLDPPEDPKMIGWCPACTTELRADEQEIAGGYLACPHCHATHRIKDIHQLDMLRLRVSGVQGTPAQLSRLLEPWGIAIKESRTRQWAARGIITPIGHDDAGKAVYLVWDIWEAHTRRAGYERAQRNSMKPSSNGENATGRDRTR